MSDQKTIVITCAGSGIGKATAQAFLAAGWNVGLLGRRSETLEEVAAGQEAALPLACDVTIEGQVERAFAQAAQKFGRIDALFNNAGLSARAAPIDEIPLAEWFAVSNTNITGMYLCARAAFGQMRRQEPQGGRIINNGSISAHAPRPGSAPYTMSKHAVTGLTKTLGLDGRPFGIAAGQIDIGNALTDMAVAMTKGVPQADGRIAVEPVMDVAEVAAAVLHMASLPLTTNIPFLTIMARDMPFLGRG
jgi:NAD(P)-dependent dehydrogenase (short-subunit alcohol dehydrogenase family)